MKHIRCIVHMFTFEWLENKFGTFKNYIDTIERKYQIVELTDEQYSYLGQETNKCIVMTGQFYTLPDFECLRNDFKEIRNNIAKPMLERMQWLFEEDGCDQVWIDSAMERIAITVRQDSFENEVETDMFMSNEPIFVKNGLLYNHEYGQRHIVSFVQEPLGKEIFDYYDEDFLHYNEEERQVVFREGVETINSQCIMDSDIIESISLPSTLREVAWGAFKRLPRLNSIIIRTHRVFENEETKLSDAFDFLPPDCTIWVPFWLKGAYSEHEFWGRYNLESWIQYRARKNYVS